MMKLKRAILATIVLAGTVLYANVADAQFRRRGPWIRATAIDVGLRMATGGYGYPRYGYGYPQYGYGVSSPASNYSQVIRARGQAAKNYSQAQLNYQEAQSKYLDNQKKWNEMYRARKKAAEAARQKKLKQREQERAERLKRRANRKPQPRIQFLPTDRDAKTGKLNWPQVLQTSEFASLRTEIQELFDLKAKTQGTPELQQKILAKEQEMRFMLMKKVNDVPTNTYMAGRNFLERMMHEAVR